MSTRVPFARNLALASSLLTAVGCSVTTPAPRFTAVSPADPAAAESAVPPPAALLTGGGEFAEEATKADAPLPPTSPPGAAGVKPGHEHHVMPEGATVYTCTMHPEVAAKEPGKCPICGMTLVKKAAASKEQR